MRVWCCASSCLAITLSVQIVGRLRATAGREKAKLRRVELPGQGNQCPNCHKNFSCCSALKTHMETHTGQFRYYCETCKKGFSNSGHYKGHMRGHEGLKYHCEYCSKPFQSKQAYQYHLSFHTGNYRFWCASCGKGFNIKSVYQQHLKSH